MRSLAILTVIAAAALPAALSAQGEPRIPVGCIYSGVTKLDRPLLVAVIKKGMQPETNEEKLIHQRVGAKVGDCTKQYGWGEKRRNLAVQYMSGRILRTDAQYHLKDHGVTYEQFDAALAALTPEQKAVIREGRLTTELYEAVSATMVAGGAKFEGLEGDKLQEVARLLLQAMQASIVAEDAKAAY